MKALCQGFGATILAVIVCAAAAAAQVTLVTGTGDPNLDVPAVQAAVDQGGQVVLMGHFSFDRPPTPPADSLVFVGQMVLVSKDVVISGTRNEQGEMTTIESGVNPFAVEAPGAHITIQGLRFVRTRWAAISVYIVAGLVITLCRIESVEPLLHPTLGLLANGIYIGTTPNGLPPGPSQPGRPERVSGTLSIFNNEINVGGTPSDRTLGIVVFSVGKSPGKEVDLCISKNNIRNITERPINVNQVGGRVRIERNVITTGTIAGPSAGVTPDGIHAVASGSFLITHNSIVSEWATGAGIRVQGNPGATEARAIVVDNDVTMSAPVGTVFGENSAGIEIRGFAQGNVVLNNRIRGRARAALSVIDFRAGIPANNTFMLNDLTGFQSSLADVFVDAGVTNTLVVGPQDTVENHGAGTLLFKTTCEEAPSNNNQNGDGQASYKTCLKPEFARPPR